MNKCRSILVIRHFYIRQAPTKLEWPFYFWKVDATWLPLLTRWHNPFLGIFSMPFSVFFWRIELGYHLETTHFLTTIIFHPRFLSFGCRLWQIKPMHLWVFPVVISHFYWSCWRPPPLGKPLMSGAKLQPWMGHSCSDGDTMASRLFRPPLAFLSIFGRPPTRTMLQWRYKKCSTHHDLHASKIWTNLVIAKKSSGLGLLATYGSNAWPIIQPCLSRLILVF